MSRESIPMINVELIAEILAELEAKSSLRLERIPAERSLISEAIEYGVRMALDDVWRELRQLEESGAVRSVSCKHLWEEEL